MLGDSREGFSLFSQADAEFGSVSVSLDECATVGFEHAPDFGAGKAGGVKLATLVFPVVVLVIIEHLC